MIPNKLQTHFPIIRSTEELLAEIRRNKDLQAVFDSWREEVQKEFLDFCTGARGVKMLYDSFFKQVMNPEQTPERLERLLSVLLGRRVKILAVLPLDSSRIAGENSLLVMDMVVELEDGSIINLEVQKLGYKFPGERAACYSSDLLLRQYKRIRGEHRKKFSYKDIKGVYTIVLFEDSSKAFHSFPNNYLHFFEQKSNTGIELELLQKYLFIPLDIFRQIQHNKDITNDLEAWLVFLSMDDPEMIVRLITSYPEFRPLYQQVYEICRNVEDVMGLFSEELRILDENTVQLMIDEMQETIDRQRAELAECDSKHKAELAECDSKHKAELAECDSKHKAELAECDSKHKAELAEERQRYEEIRQHDLQMQKRIAELEQLLQKQESDHP